MLSKESDLDLNHFCNIFKCELFCSSNNPYDINSPSFDPELYSQRLIKDASLAQLMAHENEIVKQIHALDSDMQTLVSWYSYFLLKEVSRNFRFCLEPSDNNKLSFIAHLMVTQFTTLYEVIFRRFNENVCPS